MIQKVLAEYLGRDQEGTSFVEKGNNLVFVVTNHIAEDIGFLVPVLIARKLFAFGVGGFQAPDRIHRLGVVVDGTADQLDTGKLDIEDAIACRQATPRRYSKLTKV